MGYIRSDEDYYISTGMSPEQAQEQVRKDEQGECDRGFCNPLKNQICNEEEGID